MPAAPKNKSLRVALPLIVLALGIIIPFSFLRMQGAAGSGGSGGSGGTGGQQDVADQQTSESQTDVAADATTDDAAPADTTDDDPVVEANDDPDATFPAVSRDAADEPEVEAPADVEIPEIAGLRVRLQPVDDDLTPLGGLDDFPDDTMQVDFTTIGAGVERIQMARYYKTVDNVDHYETQNRILRAWNKGQYSITPMAAYGVEINGTFLSLYSHFNDAGERIPLWREDGPGSFVAEIEDAEGSIIARIHRRYTLPDQSYDLQVRQWVENLTGDPMRIRWSQYGPSELQEDESGYRLQSRRLRLGYSLEQRVDPTGRLVRADSKLQGRNDLIKSHPIVKGAEKGNSLIWPNADRFEQARDLVWIAQSNRYFACAIHPLIDPNATSIQGLALADVVESEVIPQYDSDGDLNTNTATLGVRLTAPEITLAAGERTNNLNFGVYVGPLGRDHLKTGGRDFDDPNLAIYKAIGLDKIIVYNLGGMCAFCTFQPLAKALLALLDFLHDWVFHDWALAIVFLVFCVRGILHPVTRRSQIGIQRFSKQMQAVAPKIKKIQEKYKDDPRRMQAEQARLMREEGVNFTGALGCLPMFLQSPVWIALYAMIFYAFELRHEAGFYGVFQAVVPNWSFLADLSVPDRFIMLPFTTPPEIPLWGPLASVNILPLILGFVFFLHQKYLSPPTSATMTPEQEQQQKIMKVMMVVMFPVMLYNAPAALTIYFITNSTLGILESRWIRAHIDQMDLEPKKPKPEGRRKKVANKAPSVKKDRPRKHFKDRR